MILSFGLQEGLNQRSPWIYVNKKTAGGQRGKFKMYFLVYDIVKSHVKALGLYNFIRGFWWAYKLGAYIQEGDI